MHRFALVAGLLLIVASCAHGSSGDQGEAAISTSLPAAPSPAATEPDDDHGSPPVVTDPPAGLNEEAPGTSLPERATPEAGAADDPSGPGDDEAAPDEPRETPAPSELPETVATTVPAGVTGEVPPALLAAVLEDFSARTGLAATRAEVAIAESVIWPDGSLGCPAPGGIYEQAPVAGYRVLLRADGTAYDYHLAASGYFVLCEPLLQP